MNDRLRHLEYLRGLVAEEVSTFTRYYDRVLQWQRMDHDNGDLLRKIECPRKEILDQDAELPDLRQEDDDHRTAILLNGTLNHNHDIEDILRRASQRMGRGSRLVVVAYNPYLRKIYKLANVLGLRQGQMPSTFITETSLEHLGQLAGLEMIRIRPVGYFPSPAMGIGKGINRAAALIPLLGRFGLVSIVVFRAIRAGHKDRSLSIVIPARNERKNIEDALLRLREFNQRIVLEVIFVEGHSTDGTWEEIQRVKEAYQGEFAILAYKQRGEGKNDAVRLGFAHARNDILTILDADLTMPPELLPRFYDAYCRGLGDFINGDRLVYQMEGEAMRFMNLMGNVFFAKALSRVLESPLGDTLCGTKMLSRRDYRRIVRWREDFGDFDPFGDFELLFPAAILALGIVDIPIRYRARRYGSTNIRRFKDGIELLKMTTTGLKKIRAGKG